MFNSSTQKRFWSFSTSDPEMLNNIRLETHTEYREHFGPLFGKDKDDLSFFLTFEEEQHLVAVYAEKMSQFCKRFRPPLPPNVIGTAFHYYRRFYLNNSTMNFHPKDIYITCVFLACKIEEFNVSIDDYVLNFEEKYRTKMIELIINNEFFLICTLKFHLIIHNPYRPVKGILIDMQMRRPDLIQLPLETFMPSVTEFLEKVFYTDAIFLYAPSQISLAAILHSLSRKSISIDSYVSGCLISSEKLPGVVEAVRGIRHMVKKYKFKTTPEQVGLIEAKLELCRNPENNIDCERYRKPMETEDSIEDDSFE